MKNVDCLVGMQFGSEGKGKIAAFLSGEYNAFVRSGGPQAGHTFYDEKNKKYILRQIPCGIRNADCLLYISAGGLINLEVFIKEFINTPVYPDRLMIDNHTMVVTNKHIEEEIQKKLNERIASTNEGVGAAQSDKIWRIGKLFEQYAYENPELYFFSNMVSDSILKLIQKNGKVLLEGTQGFGLSLNHGGFYPYCTSRDVTSAALMADAGVPPKYVRNIIGIMRTYPIRVGGNSGSIGNAKEISWSDIKERSRYNRKIQEKTTVTNRTRRVFEQEFDILKKSVKVNGIDYIAVTFIDYINFDDYGVSSYKKLSNESKKYIFKIERELNVPVVLIGTGPYENQIIDLRENNEIDIIPISYDEREEYGFKNNFLNHKWGDDYFKYYLDNKLNHKRKLFV